MIFTFFVRKKQKSYKLINNNIFGNTKNRIIDKNDRRNIFIGLSKKALKEASFAKQELKNNIYGYIEYMGKEDTQEFIRLIEKTNNYFKKERKVKK